MIDEILMLYMHIGYLCLVLFPAFLVAGIGTWAWCKYQDYKVIKRRYPYLSNRAIRKQLF